MGRARKSTSALAIIVSMSPPGYPSAWLLPSRARFRFTWQGHRRHHSNYDTGYPELGFAPQNSLPLHLMAQGGIRLATCQILLGFVLYNPHGLQEGGSRFVLLYFATVGAGKFVPLHFATGGQAGRAPAGSFRIVPRRRAGGESPGFVLYISAGGQVARVSGSFCIFRTGRRECSHFCEITLLFPYRRDST